MGQLRIRWGWLARGAGVLAAGLLALQVLPGLLAPPEAPPLAADVGLPRVTHGEGTETVPPEGAANAASREPEPRPSRGVAPATAVIGTTPRQHEPRRPSHQRCGRGELLSACERKSPRPQAPAPPPPLPPAPEPAPVAPAPVPPPAPEDGSVEFAPH